MYVGRRNQSRIRKKGENLKKKTQKRERRPGKGEVSHGCKPVRSFVTTKGHSLEEGNTGALQGKMEDFDRGD